MCIICGFNLKKIDQSLFAHARLLTKTIDCPSWNSVNHLNHWCKKGRDGSERWVYPIYMTKDIRSLFSSDRIKALLKYTAMATYNYDYKLRQYWHRSYNAAYTVIWLATITANSYSVSYSIFICNQITSICTPKHNLTDVLASNQIALTTKS